MGLLFCELPPDIILLNCVELESTGMRKITQNYVFSLEVQIILGLLGQRSMFLDSDYVIK